MLWLIAQWVAASVAVFALGVLIIRLANPLPPLEPRPASRHYTETADTPLGQGVADLRSGHGEDSGIHMLIDGYDAFAARVLLARAATRTLDVQYYIWHKDLSGTLMLEAMLDAAERGVRVRMLLDDNGIAGMDHVLAALDRHPNIEIRLFNPFVIRKPKMVGYATDFFRLNRRMHNKGIIADNQAAVIGGRNVGDEYFSAAEGGLFADLDVLAIGPVVDHVSADFDRYWASQSAYPAERILSPPSDSDPDLIHRNASLVETSAAAREYVAAIKELPFIAQVLDGTLPFAWAPVRMLSDDPAKGVGKGKEDGLLMNTLHKAIGDPSSELRLISGYFVPTQAGVDELGRLAERGVDTAVFTNAFEASDVWIVHAGYAHYRREMLEKGVRVFEMRASAVDGIDDRRRRLTSMGSGSGRRSDGGPVLRSSATTLHAKTFAVDRQKLFIGSFNFDPRSMHLNTEQGFVIESPALAGAVSDSFDSLIPGNAYEIVLTDDGELNWIERRDGLTIVHTKEPGTTAFQRGGIWLLSRLPIEWLL
ncbi:phospholipase D family protein [Croceibacterium sp. LX-88]|uniref:Phospholipase D n=2 Tax=Croceibacterium selenioxidans TaxID=2838833 RepID=A0ABS5W385_9SPHN|nr:phospholipase D family protein [Croceibacterium selenioxidans]